MWKGGLLSEINLLLSIQLVETYQVLSNINLLYTISETQIFSPFSFLYCSTVIDHSVLAGIWPLASHIGRLVM